MVVSPFYVQREGSTRESDEGRYIWVEEALLENFTANEARCSREDELHCQRCLVGRWDKNCRISFNSNDRCTRYLSHSCGRGT